MFHDSPPSPPARRDRKPIFDAIRRLIGRGFRQEEVDRIDASIDEAIENAGRESPCTGLETRVDGHPEIQAQDSVSGVSGVPLIRRRPRSVSDVGIALIKRFEGCARLRPDGLVEAYPDPGSGGDPWTIGWGATGPDDRTGTRGNARIGPGTVWTQKQCDERLAADLSQYAAEVFEALEGAPTTQAQFDALVSFHYNTGAIRRATLTRKHRAGDHAGAAAEFARWNRASGRVLKGLVRRRAAEARLYAGNG